MNKVVVIHGSRKPPDKFLTEGHPVSMSILALWQTSKRGRLPQKKKTRPADARTGLFLLRLLS